jgi:C4-dicarboxylate transporter DctQ subunit
MRLVKKLTNFFDRIIVLMTILAGILLVFAMLIISGAVASRYFLGRPIGWVIEISEYVILFVTFLVAAWVLKQEEHVKMDIVLNQLNPRTQAMINVITSGISAIVCFILTWYGAKVTWELFETGYFTPTLLELPKFIIIAIIFIGSFLLFIQFLRRTHNKWGSWRASRAKERGSAGSEA